ncbi:hypothetical protein Taro_002350 [Colocasia esculenta]|uniref:Uncharacterized protein n=1 Tax=Colocasia esculenta TaxID=4460 RepID=A0A843TII6_COLES|nr:hypothetical protein [Colocasia esculenta]
MNASALLDMIRGTASVTRGTGFWLASDMGDAFKGFKRGVCPGRDFDQSAKSLVSARQSRGRSVPCRGACCGIPDGGFPVISTSDGPCGTGTTRGRRSEHGCAIGEEVLASSSWFGPARCVTYRLWCVVVASLYRLVFDHWLWFVYEPLVKVIFVKPLTVVMCPGSGTVLWFSVVPRVAGVASETLLGLRSSADLYHSSRIVESSKLVLPREEGDAIMNASALMDVIPGTASVTRGTGFWLASDMGDAFKGFKRGVCPGRDFDQSVKSFVSARQSRGCYVRRRGGCYGVPDGGFPTISTSGGPCGTGTTRGRRSEHGCAIGEEVLASSNCLVVRRLFRNTSLVSYRSTRCLGLVPVPEYRRVAGVASETLLGLRSLV